MGADGSLLVIGGGPAGVTAALQARELGAQVTLLEAGQIGGTSLNRGPAPVRTLARGRPAGARLVLLGHLRPRGPAAGARTSLPCWPTASGWPATPTTRRTWPAICAGTGLTWSRTSARSASPARTPWPPATARTWSADRIILAVGGHAGRLPIPGADLALTYEDIPSLTALPARAAVVGGADTGCQIASILDDLGAAVSLFEAGPTLLPAADPSVSVELGRRLPGPGHERAHGHAGRELCARRATAPSASTTAAARSPAS